MGFSWTPLTRGLKIKSDPLSEIKNNVDSLTSTMGISSFGWSGDESQQSKVIKENGLDELKQAIDYTDDNNVCVTDNSSYDTTVLVNNNSAVDSTDYWTNYSVRDISYDSNTCSIHNNYTNYTYNIGRFVFSG